MTYDNKTLVKIKIKLSLNKSKRYNTVNISVIPVVKSYLTQNVLSGPRDAEQCFLHSE